MSNKVFYCLTGGFVLGIFLSSFFKLGFYFAIFLLLLSLPVYFFAKFFTERKALFILLALFIFSFGLGILRYEIKDSRVGNNVLENLVGEKVIFRGVIDDEPSVKDQSVELITSGDMILTGGREYKSSEKILVSTGLFPEFKYGDLIQVEGKLAQPENFETATGKDFDYVS